MSPYIIEAENITKRYGKRLVLDGVTFQVSAGECVGIVGANGCGKSTLLGILSGSHRMTAGRLSYAGVDPQRHTRRFSEMIGYVPQENPLMPQLSVLDNLKFWYCGSGRNLKQDLASGAPAAFGLAAYADMRVDRLSGGMKKRLSIACALAKNPPVLIMDEPGASLDLVCKEDIRNYLRQYLGMGGTVLITSHEEPELALCSRLLLLKNGKMMQIQEKLTSEALLRIIRQ